MDAAMILSQATWSYSRLSAYEACPYRFFMHYLLGEEEEPEFFSQFGSFVHNILQLVYTGLIRYNEASDYYLEHFKEYVFAHPPNMQVFSSYFTDGLQYFKSIEPPEGKIVWIEHPCNFSVGEYNFTGIPDLLVERDKELSLIDHKARNLKQRSNRKSPTQTDEELDKYLRQLYLYCIPIKEAFGVYPSFLSFNCYRSQSVITERFSEQKFENAKQWAVNTIHNILNTESWSPDIDFFKCRYLCGLENQCDYYSMHSGW